MELVMTKKLCTTLAVLAIAATPALADSVGNLAYAQTTPVAAAMTIKDDLTIVGTEDLMTMLPVNADGTVRAIVEIPTGTSAKWEVSKDDPKAIYWEMRKGAPRVVNYLGYPGNYGAIPGTALPKELGGDGDPLDVIVLGQAVPRGEVVDVRLIGVLKMLDDGEQDDKLIAVLTQDSPFAEIRSMGQLDATFPGVSQIIALWFSNYKGPDGGMESQGFADAEVASGVLEAAMKNYQAAR
jgi:inorganic pyrophosphatase